MDYKPSEILRLYDIAKKKVVQKATANKKMTEGLVMRAIYETVREEMRPDEKMVDAIIERNGGKNDGLIALDVFIKNKAGECRHFALACGALFELFEKNWKGVRMGTASVDRNADERGAHGWCRYMNSKGVVFIVDAAHGVLLPLEQAALKFEKKEIMWDYRRPTDRL